MHIIDALIELGRAPYRARLTVTPARTFLVEPRAALTDEIRGALQRHRAEVVALVQEAGTTDLAACYERARTLATQLFAWEVEKREDLEYRNALAEYKRTLAIWQMACTIREAEEEKEETGRETQLALAIPEGESA